MCIRDGKGVQMIHESCRTHLDMSSMSSLGRLEVKKKKKKLAHLVLDLVIVASDFAFPKYFVAYYRCEKLFKMGLWSSRIKFLSMIILKKGVNFCGLCGLYVIFF